MTADPDLPDPKRRDRLRAKGGELVKLLIREDKSARRNSAAELVAAAFSRDLPPPQELGPTIRLRRGEVEAAEVADPDAPNRTIRRASRHDPVLRMVRAGEISQAQWAAAEQYRDDDAMAEGAKQRGDEIGGAAPWQRGHYSVRQLDAVAARRDALQAVGLTRSAVFVAVVGHCTPLRVVEGELRLQHGAAARITREALDLLADWYAGRRNTA